MSLRIACLIVSSASTKTLVIRIQSVKCNWNRISDNFRLVQRFLDEESRGKRDLSEFLCASKALQNRQWRPLRVCYTIGGSGGPRSHFGPARMGWHLEEVVRGKYTSFLLSIFPPFSPSSLRKDLSLYSGWEDIFSLLKMRSMEKKIAIFLYVLTFSFISSFEIFTLYISWYS